MHTKLWVMCPNSHPWLTPPSAYLSGNRCPHCPRNESKGEEAVRLVLEKYGIFYIKQRVLPFLPNRKYDFYFTYNNSNYIIEFDDGQHFTYVKHFHGDLESFNDSQYTDIVKAYVPVYHNIKVIRISYKEIEQHIVFALQSSILLYTSNPELYRYILDHVH